MGLELEERLVVVRRIEWAGAMVGKRKEEAGNGSESRERVE